MTNPTTPSREPVPMVGILKLSAEAIDQVGDAARFLVALRENKYSLEITVQDNDGSNTWVVKPADYLYVHIAKNLTEFLHDNGIELQP